MLGLLGAILRMRETGGLHAAEHFRGRVANHFAEDAVDPNEPADRDVELVDAGCGVLEEAEHFGFPLLQFELRELAGLLGVDQRHDVVVVPPDD